MFRFARNCQIYSQSGCKILNSYQKWMKVLLLCILASDWYYQYFDFSHSRTFVVISYSFNLQFSDNKNIHLFICLLATYISSLVRHLFRSLHTQRKLLLIFFLLNFNNSFIFWIPTFLTDKGFVTIFSQSVVCLFILFNSVFFVKQNSNFYKVQSIFFLELYF